MKGKIALNSNTLIIILLTTLVVLAIYAIFFKGLCGCGKKEHFSNSIKLEIYTAPWCGYCKQFEEGGTIQKIKDELGSDNVKHNVEGKDNTAEKMVENGVEGFPTIIVVGNGIKEAHQGVRSVKSICDFYKSKL